MPENYNAPVQKIIENYLKRLSSLLKGLPADDREELVKEVRSHIFESFSSDKTENEIDRIFKVLARLGEPSEVAAGYISEALVAKGKRKKIPLYILAGVMIGFIGIPFGFIGVGFLLTLVLTAAILVVLYYITAAALTAAGSLGVLLTTLKLIAPGFVIEMSQKWNIPGLDMDFLGGRLLLSFVIAAVGLFMLWGGKYLARGIRFLFVFAQRKIIEYRNRRYARSTGI